MRLLIADDDTASRKSLEFLTKRLGYEVLSSSDGRQAWEVWQRERPKLVITDWEMPEMNGPELCKAIRETEGDDYTYIVMVSVKGESDDIVEGMDSGADDYLTKPYNKQELRARLRAGERVQRLQSNEMVVFALARLAESRDTDTGNHLQRIRYYCRTLATAMLEAPDPPPELNRKFIDDIFLTSPLHDIGKIGIPDHILLKPGRLDDREFAIMKTHTVIGYETFAEVLEKYPRMQYLQMGADIALSHHEKYDGSGYPHGRKGEEISLAARICAVADVYDALISKRAYKDAYTCETAIAIIREGRGNHFDPLVIDAFERSLGEIRDIQKRFQ